MLTKDDLSNGDYIVFNMEKLEKIKSQENLQLVTKSSSKDLINGSVHRAFELAIKQACRYKFGAVPDGP